jgi:glutathionyl-hydroquinone reductase
MSRKVFTKGLKAMETQWLADNKYLTGDAPTIADMAAYVELGQLKKEFTNTFDYSDFPNVSRWLDDMTQMDGHDDSHLVLKELGDISQGAPEMERIMGANMKGIEIVKQKIAEM